MHVLLTGCWGVGCLWSKEGYGHLRCLPWWRRISTQTVWLLKTETSPWAANTAMGQHSPYTVCVSASPSTCIPGNDHARLWNLSTWVEFIYFLLLPLSRIHYRLVFFPNFVSTPYWHVADTPPIKWAERSLRHTDVWYAECACFISVFFCVSKRRFKFKKKMTQWEWLNKRDRKRVTQRTDCDSHITCGYHQEVILVSTHHYTCLSLGCGSVHWAGCAVEGEHWQLWGRLR